MNEGQDNRGQRAEDGGRTAEVCRRACSSCKRTMCTGAKVLAEIAGMPAYDPEIGLTADQVGSTYEEIRKIAAQTLWLMQAEERGRVCAEIRQEMDAEDAAGKRFMIRNGDRDKYLRVKLRGRATGAYIHIDWANKGECFELVHSDALAIRAAYAAITGEDQAILEEVDNG